MVVSKMAFFFLFIFALFFKLTNCGNECEFVEGECTSDHSKEEDMRYSGCDIEERDSFLEMFGVYLNGFGDTSKLEFRDNLGIPRIAKEDEIKVEIHFSGFNHLDTKLRKGYMPHMNVSILGIEYSGIITKIGSEVKDLKIGDRVFGFSLPKMSTYAQYVVLPQNQVRKIPDGIELEEAATYPCSILTIFQSFKKLFGADKTTDPKTYENEASKKIMEGKTLVIVGCSGPLGITAYNLAKYVFGCSRIIGICSGKNHDGMKKLGIDAVYDYRKNDYVDEVMKENPDFIIDCYGGYDNLELYSKKRDEVLYVTPGVPDGVNPGEFIQRTTLKKNMFFVGHKNIPDELALVSDLYSKFGVVGKSPISIYDLKDVKKCHDDYSSKRPIGKMILKVKL